MAYLKEKDPAHPGYINLLPTYARDHDMLPASYDTYVRQYIQTVMGYSPIEAGVAFLPFCFGLVLAAGISSNLINRIDPRFLAGVGTLMAATALFGFSRIPSDTTMPIQDLQASYWTDILPFIVLMSFGMGMVFVPLTLTAVHHLRPEDSGIAREIAFSTG